MRIVTIIITGTRHAMIDQGIYTLLAANAFRKKRDLRQGVLTEWEYAYAHLGIYSMAVRGYQRESVTTTERDVV